MTSALNFRILLVLCCAALLAGCPEKAHTPTEPQPGGPDAGAPIDAGLPGPVGLQLSVRFHTDAGLQTVDFEPGDKPVAPQTDLIELDSNQRISNYRVRLFDEVDKAVPSDDSPQESPNALHYSLQLKTPLRAGFRYALVLDAQTGAAMLDAEGKPLSDVRLEFKVAGEKEKPAPPAKKKPVSKKKRR